MATQGRNMMILIMADLQILPNHEDVKKLHGLPADVRRLMRAMLLQWQLILTPSNP